MAQQPNPWKSLSDEVGKIRENIKRLQNRSPFFGTGFHSTADNGIESDNFDGDLNAGNAGTMGWSMDSDQAAFGQLILRPGSITNDVLANPVLPDVSFVSGNTFGFTVAGAVILTAAKTTPAGFTRCLVFAASRVAGVNSTGSSDALYSDIDVNGTGGNQFPTQVSAGAASTSVCAFSTLVTGLTTGAAVNTHVYASTGLAAWASSAANAADLSVSYLWLR